MHISQPDSSRPPRTTRRLNRAATLSALGCLVAAALLTSCASSATPPPAATSTFRGDRLPHAIALPAAAQRIAFHSTTGGTTTLGRLQKNRLMLLYFGYTHCPDVCPATMANLGVALRQLPTIIQARTQVVFVTSDPARDTTSAMTAWLSHFDPGLPHPFVGLTAGVKQIDSVARSVGVPLSPPVKQPNGSITVQHGAQTLAFIAGRANVLWTAGTTPGDYEHDIALLAAKVDGA